MRRFLFFFLAIATILFASCQKKDERCQPILQEGGRYQITLLCHEVAVTGDLFFSEGGVLHFLHTDQTTPRFGMEEILEKERVTALLDQMRHEGTRQDRGTGLLYPLVHALRSVAPKKEEDVWRFEGDEVDVLWDGEHVEGVVCGQKIRVNFLSAA